MRKSSLSLVAVATAALFVALSGAPALAAAPAVLTYGSVGGADAAVGDVLGAGLASGTAATFSQSPGSTTGVSCAASAFSATVTDNPVAPAVATESLTAQSFGTGPANIIGVLSVTSVVVDNLPYNTTVDSATSAVTVTGTATAPIQTTIRLRTLLGTVTCVYQADNNTVTGVADNTDNSITFTNQQFNRTAGPGTCFANGYFTAKYAPVVDTTQAGSPSIYVN
jgi:hypothetical protein